VDTSRAPVDYNDSAFVYSDLIDEAQAKALLDDITPRLKRRRYEGSHWDSVIVSYKEVEIDEDSLSETSRGVLQTVRELAQRHSQKESLKWLPCHVIDLAADGELNAHVDSVRFSGDIVSGL
jgi:alkylated DNA repair protein alkB family protein 7